MKFFIRAAASLLLATSLQAVADGDASAGQAKSAICAACHGADGNSSVPNWPKLAGQHANYIARQMTLIKSGDRPVPEMMGFVAGLSDQDHKRVTGVLLMSRWWPLGNGFTRQAMRIQAFRPV